MAQNVALYAHTLFRKREKQGKAERHPYSTRSERAVARTVHMERQLEVKHDTCSVCYPALDKGDKGVKRDKEGKRKTANSANT